MSSPCSNPHSAASNRPRRTAQCSTGAGAAMAAGEPARSWGSIALSPSKENIGGGPTRGPSASGAAGGRTGRSRWLISAYKPPGHSTSGHHQRQTFTNARRSLSSGDRSERSPAPGRLPSNIERCGVAGLRWPDASRHRERLLDDNYPQCRTHASRPQIRRTARLLSAVRCGGRWDSMGPTRPSRRHSTPDQTAFRIGICRRASTRVYFGVSDPPAALGPSACAIRWIGPRHEQPRSRCPGRLVRMLEIDGPEPYTPILLPDPAILGGEETTITASRRQDDMIWATGFRTSMGRQCQ